MLLTNNTIYIYLYTVYQAITHVSVNVNFTFELVNNL